ncbi:MAG TPA: hypothetical protein VMS77_06315 [Conexivisphaerales archaeon]|nr:hypothetical protein [Conexivisphaerales archaeon]
MGLVSFLKGHPVLCLFLLTPGIPEYLTSSSPLNAVLLNPGQFMFQVLANGALYLPGALLVREAMIRWKKGWATVLLLGAAYGILEEGVALSTLFDSKANPVGNLGFYGHWLGVSWVWTAGILLVHMIYSIALPIMLLSLALPETRGRSFLTGRGLVLTFGVLGMDVTFLCALITFGVHFWMGWPVFFGSWVAIGVLILVARKAPASLISPSEGPPKVGRIKAFLMGLAFFLVILFTEQFPMALSWPPALAVAAMCFLEGVLLTGVLRSLGTIENERALVALFLGIISPICVFGVLAELPLPFTLFGDALAMWFAQRLWAEYPQEDARPQPATVLYDPASA